jgi:hypothetical protein
LDVIDSGRLNAYTVPKLWAKFLREVEMLGPLQAVERYIFSHPEYTERRQALLERAQLLLQELQEELLA